MVSERVTRVLSHFENVTQLGDGWSAKCPAHDDGKPSLSINCKDGKILFYCHAGCTQQEVMEATGLEWADLFLNDQPRSKISVAYDYQDKAGKLIYQIIRYEPKDFRARRPDGQGGWIYKLDGVGRVPYRLPEVLASDRIIITEGEKDADTGKQLGFVATCNPGGAGKGATSTTSIFVANTFELFLIMMIPVKSMPAKLHARCLGLPRVSKFCGYLRAKISANGMSLVEHVAV